MIFDKKRISDGLSDYEKIMKQVDAPTFCDANFRKLYNHFYRLRQKPEKWYNEYYSLMEDCKNNPKSFKEVLTELYKRTGEIHASFSSKLVATLNADMPIWDQYVLANLGLKPAPYYLKPEERINRSAVLYEKIIEWYKNYLNSAEGQYDISIFDSVFPEYKWISNTKKLDFMLWSKRENESSDGMGHKNETVSLTNMCMVYDGSKILVQDRIKSWCGIAFPGGHIEEHESIVDSVVREIYEETGLNISNPVLCGVKQWFKDGMRNICFLFKANHFTGTLKSNDEGRNFWIERNDLEKYKLASNFDIMLKVFENDSISEHYHERMYDDSKDILK